MCAFIDEPIRSRDDSPSDTETKITHQLASFPLLYYAVKVDREKQKVVLDEFHEDISVEDLRDELPGHQPRYVVYSYRMEHDDKRVSYPICFIFYTPRDSRVRDETTPVVHTIYKSFLIFLEFPDGPANALRRHQICPGASWRIDKSFRNPRTGRVYRGMASRQIKVGGGHWQFPTTQYET